MRLGDMTFQDARSVVTRFASATPVSLQRLTPLLGSAFDIAHRYQRTVYDSLYLALAVAEGCQLITADERLVNSLQGTPLAGAVLGLSST